EEGTTDLKVRYYDLTIQYGIHEQKYLDVSRYYYQLYTTDAISLNPNIWPDILNRLVLFCVMAKYDNEQSDMLNRLIALENIDKLPQCAEFAKLFSEKKLISWNVLLEEYQKFVFSDYSENYKKYIESESGSESQLFNKKKQNDQEGDNNDNQLEIVELQSSKVPIFDKQTEYGKNHISVLKNRVMEHNIRVIALYYNRISLKRISELVGMPLEETESKLCSLVVDGLVYAKIDRPNQIVNFLKKKTVSESLDIWVSDVNNLLGLVEKTTHLIEKENILYKISH
ncbi:hypothetical protein BB560_006799, partial [Smittium megazygosporum]